MVGELNNWPLDHLVPGWVKIAGSFCICLVLAQAAHAGKSAPYGEHFVRVDERWSDAGARIRILTSSDRGLSVMPLPEKAFERDWVGTSVTFRELVSGRRVRRFCPRERSVEFALYTWCLDVPAREDDEP